MAPLSGKRAVVVGMASRHAPAVVRTLRDAGAEVVVVDRPGVSAPGESILACDMSEAGIADVVEALERDGRAIDILVTTPPPLAEAPTATDAATLDAVLASGLRAPFLWSAAVIRPMQARRSGVVVHVTGPSGLGGWRGWQAAGAVFAGVHNLVQSAALDTASSGVRVNALVPGVTADQAALIAGGLEQPVGTVVDRIPLGSFLPEDALGKALLYLVHPSSSYVSGSTLVVDGGWTVWGRLRAVAS
jgi:NAD(P)-dependent dehydrogenase (short-subunit alcohol dehydrogenase family)